MRYSDDEGVVVTLYKYKYFGDGPMILTEHHKEVENNGDVIEVETPIESVFFVLVEEKPTKQIKEATN